MYLLKHRVLIKCQTLIATFGGFSSGIILIFYRIKTVSSLVELTVPKTGIAVSMMNRCIQYTNMNTTMITRKLSTIAVNLPHE